LPEGLDQVLLACLSPNPADRPSTGEDLENQLKLCLQPHVRRLLLPRAGSLRQTMRNYPIRVFIVAGVIPHAIFSVLSIVVNYFLVIKPLGAGAEGIFWKQILTVNSIAYAAGIGVGVYLVWPVIKAIRGYNRKSPPNLESLPALRRRSLVIGDYVTGLGFGLWLLSGFVFPAWLQLAGIFDPLKTDSYTYFFLSQVICGLIASTQTFFLLTFVSVRGFHPMLIPADRSDVDHEIERLLRLSRRARYYLGLAFVAPLLAFLVLGLIDIPDQGVDTKWATKLATIGLAVIGALSVWLVWRLLGAIQGDIAALAAAVDPERTAPQSSIDTVESFWASSTR
jgi:eukaryotic-like serine/threonine-protein kinase